MLVHQVNTKLCSAKQFTHLAKVVTPALSYQASSVYSANLPRLAASPRLFSTTSSAQLRDFFPVKETEHIRQTPPTWPHHGLTEKEMVDVVPGHRKPRTLGDKFAWSLVRISRWGMDKVSGLSSEQQQINKGSPTTSIVAAKPLTEAQWLSRFIFLESIAAVPGMVAGMLRHLHSLRRLKRDNGWIETLLEEAYNERMHLLTFLKMCEPGWLMKILIIGAQGVYFNAMFVAYLISPKICHRFVGYLEEEAVHTYTRSIEELERGDLPKWSDPKFQVPEIAVSYWGMPEGHRTMRDLLLYIRADEANHRGVHHTLGNLNQVEDPNPFVSDYKGDKPRPVAASRPEGFEREEVIGKEVIGKEVIEKDVIGKEVLGKQVSV
ncbi:Alternative oxidase, mitochondrial precursor [Pyricularia oryzae]|uniref:Alternative oxidase, mitochondrial n=3 Tax=Pyricularia TaxID=48558 RepID=AOX_PYRO7|nr:alternative oxidase [Pyricularia oryzae 70-15]O93788.1 RecName: Full=Alternative oxidase, mitochondrial; AltName: Full=AOXMg; AltName: Full=MgAOX; Flags: Precursor [Pyricularia oryzae 70-15]AAG49588.1 alternative terminal oxidase [Pyricularia grisea]KAH8848044.1 Alternative oxidase, mitochondrial precursor [Pyricularia oryzae]EHA52856.1 alternative oxidase [Pyricularia oryzae 70-15]KAH9430018.1 Alternative oxidase, mitochondrial precursor [Pyricularia oryzae]KAI6285896.1 Alternative oxidas